MFDKSIRVGSMLITHFAGDTFKAGDVLPVYIQIGKRNEEHYYPNPYLFAVQGDREVLFSEFYFNNSNFNLDYALEYDGVKVGVVELMEKSALLVVTELAPWDGAPEVGRRFWANFDDEYLKYTGE